MREQRETREHREEYADIYVYVYVDAMAMTGPEGQEAVVRSEEGAPMQPVQLRW